MNFVSIIDDYRNFGPIAKAVYPDAEWEMDGALFVVAKSNRPDLDSKDWSKKAFKHQSDAILFIRDLVEQSSEFRIIDKIYWEFNVFWNMDHFNSSLELARLLLDEDDGLSQLMGDDDDRFPPGPWWR
ncbi:hypothetical protein [Burkholderia vietnamiensis]|uniref:hypothetical protein n=1 Tax=Burkholderia vietnamiensis TaxID=60552 RepID=UPI00264ABF25|nr:hypothetical protein [Burkholderia vietnamiensis]MDN7925570.1 hypothetical protein [Burkholderia vietnamiensis]